MASIGTVTGRERTTFRLPLRLLGDDRLARMAARGERRAFEAVFARYHRELYRYCRAILGDPEEADDALQSTMAVALRHLPKAERRTSLRGWLYRVAHNEAVSMLRRRPLPLDPLQLPEGSVPGADVRVEERERLRRLVGDLRALPDRQRGALLMRELSDLSYAQIAEALETSQAAARQLVHEARSSLRAVRVRRDLDALFPPLAPAGATGGLASLLGGLGQGGAALGGAGVKAASIASVVVLGAGVAGVGGGIESPFAPRSDPPPAAHVPPPAGPPHSFAKISQPGGAMAAGASAVEHASRPAHVRPAPGDQAAGGRSRRGEATGSQPHGHSAPSNGGDAGHGRAVGQPPAAPGATHASSPAQPSSAGVPAQESAGSPPAAADQGLAQAASPPPEVHGTSAAAPEHAVLPVSRAGGNSTSPGRARTSP